MAKSETGIYVVLGEVNLLISAVKRSTRWASQHFQSGSEFELVENLIRLKGVLVDLVDLKGIAPLEYLLPFLDVVRSEHTSGVITSLALTSINKFISYKLIECENEILATTVGQIADAVTHARFVGTDPSSDEVVLLKILHVLRSLVMSHYGVLLTNDAVCEIMQSCFRICFEVRLGELLRRSSEQILVEMVQLLFTRLPQFKEDAKWSANMRKLKMRAGSNMMDPSKGGPKMRKKSPKVKTKGGTSVVKQDAATAEVVENTSSDAIQGSDEKITSCPTQRLVEPPSSLSLEIPHDESQPLVTSEVTPASENSAKEIVGLEMEPLKETGLKEGGVDQYVWVAPQNCEDSRRDSIATQGSVEGGPEATKDFGEKESSDFINPRGIRFTSQMTSSTNDLRAEVVLTPYGIPCVRELLRFLISLTSPLDPHNTEVMIYMGLSLITVALECGADHLAQFKSLLSLVKDDMCKNLFFLLKCEKLNIYASSTRICFLLFESLRSHLKLQMEMYITKVMEIIVSESHKLSHEHKEIALDSIIQILHIPGLASELFLNFDCDLYCTNLFEDLTKLLSKNAFPVSGLMNTHLLSLDALLTIVDAIEEDCHHRMMSSKTEADASPSQNDDGISKKLSTSSNNLTSTSAFGFGSFDNLPRLKSVAKSLRMDTKLPKIRPNRMKASRKIPTCEDLSSTKHKKKIYQTGTEQFNVKPQEGITYLQKHGFLSQQLDPGEIVSFIKQNPKLDKKQIGEFISNRKNNNILEAYQKSFNFEGTRIDEALRMYLETFRLPGEAPVISYLLEHFADHWHKTNGEPFKNADAAFTLAYAVIMLNVDQHNLNAKKQNTPMTCENFKKNLSKVNGGQDFEEEMLEEMFQSIKNEEIVMPAEQVGIVRDNYLWKVLLRRGQTKDSEYMHVPTGCYDRDLFAIVWGPTVAALSFVFDRSNDDAIIQKAINGFRKCALISAHYEMSDVFDNLVISLCKFTTLLSSSESSESLAISFGNNPKAQLAARTVFGLTHRHSDILHDGWRNILDCILQLFRAKLLNEVLTKVEDFLDPSGSISLIKEEQSIQQRADSGMFSGLYTFFSLSDAPQQKGPAPEDQEAIKRAQDCILECHVEQLIIESKFLREDSLQELIKALIFGLRCSDGLEDSNHHQEEEVQVFRLELLFKVVLQNRDRIYQHWANIEEHLCNLLINAVEASFLVERVVVGLLRLAVRLLRREELAHQVLSSLRIFLLMKSEVLHGHTSTHISRHISYGMHDLLKTNASNIHTAPDWGVIFTILCVVGASMESRFLNKLSFGAQSDVEVQSDSELNTSKKNSDDRGYTSDSELYDGQKSSTDSTNKKSPSRNQHNINSSWFSNYLNKDKSNRGADGSNKYSITLNAKVGKHDFKSFSKCCEILSFLVRDATHMTPLNFASCVQALRVFVEASADGGVHNKSWSDASKTAIHTKKGHHHKKAKSSLKKEPSLQMRKSRSSPSHLVAPLNRDIHSDEEEQDSDAYQTISIQLLDLMHTMHTRAATIFNSWAEEKRWTEAAKDAIEANKVEEFFEGDNQASSHLETSLWSTCWCPLLQGIARLCCDARKQVRNHALTYLQRALLVHDLQVLQASEWEDCFSKVLFPLLSRLLEGLDPQDKNGAEETRMRASALLCKVFLQHLTPLLNLSTFTALWLTILDFMDQYMHADHSDLLLEAIPESLKNMLLVMHTAGILHQTEEEEEDSQLWKLTWDRIDSFLPSLREEVFKTHENESRVSRDSSPASESHQQQTPSHDDAVTNTTPTTQGPKTLPESLVASVPPLGLPSQYVLHPPLPSVTDLHTSTIPLILNQDVLQSTVIPFMPAKVKVDSAGQ